MVKVTLIDQNFVQPTTYEDDMDVNRERIALMFSDPLGECPTLRIEELFSEVQPQEY